MKKFSRMPKSESGGLGGVSGSGSGSSSGVSSYFGKVFAVGRYQVTVEELVAEGMYKTLRNSDILKSFCCTKAMKCSGTHPSAPIWTVTQTMKQLVQLWSIYGSTITSNFRENIRPLPQNVSLFSIKISKRWMEYVVACKTFETAMKVEVLLAAYTIEL